jgi:FkbM family methyltransferase
MRWASLIRGAKRLLKQDNYVIINSVQYHFPKSTPSTIETRSFTTEAWLIDILNMINNYQEIRQFIDAGVNVGQTLLKIKSINSNTRYIGFDPNPKCLEFVAELIKVNNLQEIQIVNKGLSNKETNTYLEFTNNDRYDSSASTVKGFRSNIYRRVESSVNSLDSLIEPLDLNVIDIIKVDIEGGELEAIEGMQETLKDFKPIIILEVLPDYEGQNPTRTQRQAELSKIFADLDYNLFQIHNKADLSLKAVKTVPSHSNVSLSDYIAFPGNKNPKDYNLIVESPTAT